MHRTAFAIGTALGMFATPLHAEFAHIELGAAFHRIEAEVAFRPTDRALGLMHRNELGTNRGMLFVFAANDRHCMWMRNTLLPLSVAFIDQEGKILNIEDMAPQTDKSHCASRPARFALEMNRGWFAVRGIKAGQRLSGLEKAPQPE